MLNQQQFYNSIHTIERSYGLLFLVVGMVMLTAANAGLYPPARRWIERGVLTLWPSAWLYLLGVKLFRPPRPFWRWMWITAILLRLPGLTQSFWYDETWSGAIARLPLSRLPEIVMADVHPPLPYFLFWLNGRIFGTSEIVLRLPSLALGLLSIYLFYRLTKYWFGFTTARTAAVLLACLPAHIYYSTEARGYMLLVCLVLGGMLAIVENRPRWFLVTGLLGWSHAFGFLYLAALGIAAFLIRPRWRWGMVVAWSGLLSAAWLPFMLRQTSDVSNGFWLWDLSPGGALWFLVEMTVSQHIGEHGLFLVLLPVMVVIIASVWGFRHWLRPYFALIWVSVAVGVPVSAAFISWAWRPIYLNRALLPCAVLFVLLWALLLTYSERRRMYRALLIPALVVAVIYSSNHQREDLRGAFHLCEGADSVYAMSSAVGVMAQYYATAPVWLRPLADDLNQSISYAGKVAFGLPELDIEALTGRVCVVAQYNPLTEKNEERRYLSGRVFAYPVEWAATPIKRQTYWFQVFMVNLND